LDLATKLQLKPGQTVALVNAPAGVATELPIAPPPEADGVLAFVVTAADLDAAGAAVDAALSDRLAWIAYPKAGGLGTDLNRDRLAALMGDRGAQPVRQVAIDDVWSALRFRPK
jgi:hypothetical protein